MSLSPAEERCWQAYLNQLPPSEQWRGSKVTASYAGSREMTDRLIDLYLTGRKTAGSGLVEDYLTAGDPLPAVGDHWIALGQNGEPRCILRTERVETHAFRDVPERIAVAEGEGDLSLDYWRHSHAAHYCPHLEEWGIVDIEEATVVTEHFTIVFRQDPPHG
jgi:uncharacterized protein YhfF